MLAMFAGDWFSIGELAMDELTSLSRMARRLGVTQQWLREQADAGNVPCLKAGKRYLFNPPAVEAILVQQAAINAKGVDHERQ